MANRALPGRERWARVRAETGRAAAGHVLPDGRRHAAPARVSAIPRLPALLGIENEGRGTANRTTPIGHPHLLRVDDRPGGRESDHGACVGMDPDRRPAHRAPRGTVPRRPVGVQQDVNGAAEGVPVAPARKHVDRGRFRDPDGSGGHGRIDPPSAKVSNPRT